MFVEQQGVKVDGGVRLEAGSLAEAHMIRRRKSPDPPGVHTCPPVTGRKGASAGPLGATWVPPNCDHFPP